MSKFLHIKESVFNQCHLYTPEYANSVLSYLSHRLDFDLVSDIEVDAKSFGKEEDNLTGYFDKDIYVMPIRGSLVHKAGAMDAFSGICSYEGMQKELIEAKNKGAKKILLDMSTNGGMVSGAFDFKDFLLELKKEIPIYALARDSANSAGYLIASACDKVYVSQTAQIGSIGVVYVHEDISSKLEEQKVKVTFFKAGDFKTSGNPYEPLSKKDKEYIQSRIDQSYDMFVEAVASTRNLTKQEIIDTQAKVYTGQKAVDIGLADGVRTLESTLQEMYSVSKTGKFSQGDRMENEELDQLKASLEASKTENETLKASIISAGFKITSEGIEKQEPKETIMVAGIETPKDSLPDHVLQALEQSNIDKLDAELESKAKEALPNFKLDVAKELVSSFGDNKEVMENLKAANALFESTMEEVGDKDEDSDLMDNATKYENLVQKTASEKGLSLQEAKIEVQASKEGRELIKEILKENK